MNTAVHELFVCVQFSLAGLCFHTECDLIIIFDSQFERSESFLNSTQLHTSSAILALLCVDVNWNADGSE